MELKKAVALCEADKRSAKNERRDRHKRIVEKPGPNGSTMWYEEDGKAPVNLIWSSQDLQREVTLRTAPSIMDLARKS
jgi:hypothetical protein